MIDRKFIGLKAPDCSVLIESGQLRLFAEATSEPNELYRNEAISRRAKHRALLAPPTFAQCLVNLAATGAQWLLEQMQVPMGGILHGEQHFEYFEPLYAGDLVTLEQEVADLYDKKGGQLEFIALKTSVISQAKKLCVRHHTVLVVQHL